MLYSERPEYAPQRHPSGLRRARLREGAGAKKTFYRGNPQLSESPCRVKRNLLFTFRKAYAENSRGRERRADPLANDPGRRVPGVSQRREADSPRRRSLACARFALESQLEETFFRGPAPAGVVMKRRDEGKFGDAAIQLGVAGACGVFVRKQSEDA